MFYAPPVGDTFKPMTVPAPVGGLNSYDSLAAMPPTDAIIMQNWWPQPYGCVVRNGYVEWTTGLPSTVETLAGWFDLNGNQKMFAWSAGGMYDISTRLAAGAAIVSGLTESSWETVTLTNSADNYLICVNGVDNGIIYRTAGVARLTAGDGTTPNTWAGLSPADAVQLCVHQRRLWAVEKNSSRGWYLPPDAIQGTFVSFDFGPQFSRGGYLQYLTTWTLDDGSGAQNQLIAMSSRGEAVIYSGTNPNDSNAWALTGVYYVGTPVAGRRSFVKAGGDQLIITQRGVVSMVGELVSTKVEEADEPLTSKKIQFLLSTLISELSTLNGWQIIYHPPLNMVLLAIPSVTAGGNTQLAANQIIQSWAQFTNMDGACWLSHNEQLYFGDYSGKVYQAWTGFSDKVLLDNTGGEGVTASIQQAYSYFGGRSSLKQVGLYRPTFVTGGQFSYNAAIVYNFKDKDVPVPGLVPLPLGSLWGTGLWGTSIWVGGTNVEQSWLAAEGIGVAASLKMVTTTVAELLWVSTDFSLVETSGIL